jgi:hypothetical protein
MPENATQRIGPRASLPPVATGYEVAPTAAAHPTDPYSPTAAAEGGGKTNDLLQALGVATKVAIPAAMAFGEQWAGQEKKRGVEARLANAPLDQSKSNAFIDGYERMDGQYKGIQFEAAVKSYTAENGHLKPEEFQQGLDKLQQEHLGGIIHQGQLDSFVPKALKAAEDSAKDYQKIKTDEVIKERNTKVTAISESAQSGIANDALKEIGIPGGLQQLIENPLLAATVIANKEKFVGIVGPKVRSLLDDMRSQYKALGMSTSEISAILLGQVGRLAVSSSAPELMSYAFIKDASGISVADAYPEKVDEFMKHAVQNRKTFTHEALALQRQQEKEAVVAYTNNMYFAAAALPGGDNKGAMNILTALQNSGMMSKMDPSDTRRMTEDLFAIVNRKGFSEKSDPDIYTDLRLRAELKQTTPAEIYVNRKSLSFANFSEILNNLTAKEAKDKDEAKDAELDVYRRGVDLQLKSLEQVLHPLGPGGGVLNPNNSTVLARARSQFTLGLEDLLAANGRKRENIRAKDLEDLGKRVVESNRGDVKYIVQGKDINYYKKDGSTTIEEKAHGAVKPGVLPSPTPSAVLTNILSSPYATK